LEESFKFYENTKCEYYPCHDISDSGLDNFNCTWCYCPLYQMEECGGNYNILPNGIKDCSNCLIPHIPENYDYILGKLEELRNKSNKGGNTSEKG